MKKARYFPNLSTPTFTAIETRWVNCMTYYEQKFIIASEQSSIDRFATTKSSTYVGNLPIWYCNKSIIKKNPDLLLLVYNIFSMIELISFKNRKYWNQKFEWKFFEIFTPYFWIIRDKRLCNTNWCIKKISMHVILDISEEVSRAYRLFHVSNAYLKISRQRAVETQKRENAISTIIYEKILISFEKVFLKTLKCPLNDGHNELK